MKKLRREASAYLDSAAALKRSVRLRSARECFNEFSLVDAPFRHLKAVERPPLLRMYGALADLESDVAVHDIGRFFTEYYEWAPYAAEAKAFLEQIGARRTAQFLGEAIALFPRGRVPRDYAKCVDAVERIRQRVPDPFAQLNQRYRKGVSPELYPAFQRWARAHEAGLLAELAPAKQDTLRSMEWLNEALALRTPTDRIKGGASKEHVALYAIWDRAQSRLDSKKPRLGLSHGEHLLHILFFVMEGEIENGGIVQFFSNSSGDFAEQAKTYLSEIGARQTLAVLKKASRIFPGGKVPTSRKSRNRVLDKLTDPAMEKLHALSHEHTAAAGREMHPRLLSYIKRHKADFVGPD